MAVAEIQALIDLFEVVQSIDDSIFNELSAANVFLSDDEDRTFMDDMKLINDDDMKGFTERIKENFDMEQIKKLFEPIENNQKLNDEQKQNNEFQSDMSSFFSLDPMQSNIASNPTNFDDPKPVQCIVIDDKKKKETIGPNLLQDFLDNLSDLSDDDNLFGKPDTDNDIDMDVLQNDLKSFFGQTGLQSMFTKDKDNGTDNDDDMRDDFQKDLDTFIKRDPLVSALEDTEHNHNHDHAHDHAHGHSHSHHTHDHEDIHEHDHNSSHAHNGHNDDKKQSHVHDDDAHHHVHEHDHDHDSHHSDHEHNDEHFEFETDLSNFGDLKNIFMQNINDKNDENKQQEEECKMNEIEILEQMELMQKSEINEMDLIDRKCTLNYQIINKSYLKQTQNKYCPLLLIHGLCEDRNIWNMLLPKLMSYPSCIISVSLKGFGDSSKFEPKECVFSIDECMNDMIALMNALNISKAIWIGHGFGTFICQKAAVENDDIVHKMVLIAPHYTLTKEVGTKWKETLKNKGFDAFVEQIRNGKKFDKCEKCRENVLDGIIGSMMKFDSLQYLKYIECPVYILAGEGDNVFGKEAAYQINKCIKSSLITCYSNADHYLICDKRIVSNIGMIIWDFCRR